MAITSPNTILLIEDDQDDCYLFTDAVKKIFPSITITNANNFLEAVAHLTLSHPDIIFLDLNMPFKNGIESLTELKANSNFKDIPVVIFSNSDYPKDIKLSYEKGAALYFTKPSFFDDLVLGLQQILYKDWSRPAVITAKQFVDGKYEAFTLEATS